MTDRGLAGSEHYSFPYEDPAQRFTLAGVVLAPGLLELIQGQLQLMQKAVDEANAARYVYQVEGILLTLSLMNEITQADAEALRRHLHALLPATLAAMVSVP